MTKIRSGLCVLVAVACLSMPLANAAYADNILIVNGASLTSEAGTTANITATLDGLLQSQGHTTTISDPVPADLSPFDQVWDIRFANASPISAGEEAQFLAFLQGGGNMFVMGENSGFGTRNNSVLSLIQAAGGGTLSFVTPNSTQNVNPPANIPNAITTITYCAPGGATGGGVTAGNGIFLTDDGVVGGTAIGFATGTLTNAPAGSLSIVFDVNFMEPCGPNNYEFLENLTGYVSEGGNPTPASPVAAPVMSPPALLLLAGGYLLLGCRRLRRAEV